MRPVNGTSMRFLEAAARQLAALIDAATNRAGKRYGFTLFLFSFEGPELAYISNAQRKDMIKAVEEWLQRQRSGEADTTWSERN